MLSKYHDWLPHYLTKFTPFNPWPNINDRDFWNNVNPELSEYYLSRAEKYIDYNWSILPAVRYMDFKINGNRTNYENQYFERRKVLTVLVLSECIENKGRFIESIINLIWCICEESSWCLPAHQNERGNSDPLPDKKKPIIDLFAAETAASLAMTMYLLKPFLQNNSSILCQRIVEEVSERVLNSCLQDDFYHWMGFYSDRVNNHTTWTYMNCLLSFLVLEQDYEKKLNFIYKTLCGLDKFISCMPSDGGCDEGPGYWTVAAGCLFDTLELLYFITDGMLNIFNEKIIENLGKYIANVNICRNYYVNYADSDTKVNLPNYLVFGYGKRIDDKNMIKLAVADFLNKSISERTGECRMLYRSFMNILNYSELLKYDYEYPYMRDSWLDKIQVVTSREINGSSKGLFFSAKGGHNDEFHNHNDVGSFILYLDGMPVFIDPGVGDYTSKTFSNQRYEIWTMQSQFHNTPSINGIGQKEGKQFKSKDVNYNIDGGTTIISMDISPSYPEEIKPKQWIRKFIFKRGDKAELEVTDEYLFSENSIVSFNLMTVCNCNQTQNGKLIFEVNKNKQLTMEYDENSFEILKEIIPLSDEKLINQWGDRIYRIILKAKQSCLRGNTRLLFKEIE